MSIRYKAKPAGKQTTRHINPTTHNNLPARKSKQTQPET